MCRNGVHSHSDVFGSAVQSSKGVFTHWQLAVGHLLDELKNDITRETPASFEPSIDYVVTKIPRFAFEKFAQADPTLTTQMKSVGEAMAIGRTFKESLQKCLRSLEIGRSGLGGDGKPWRIGTEVYGDRDILPPPCVREAAANVSTGQYSRFVLMPGSGIGYLPLASDGSGDGESIVNLSAPGAYSCSWLRNSS